jgi:hypothetical protein
VSATTVPGRASASRLLQPPLTPYDRQLLVQSIRRAVALWGAARIELGTRALVVVREPVAPERRCDACGGCPGPLGCRRRGSLTCIECALDPAGDAPSSWAILRPSAGRHPHSGHHSRRVDALRPSPASHRQ